MSSDTPGTIDRHTVYRLDEFCRRLGIGRAGWRSLKQQGLRTRTVGKRTLIVGEDFFRWLDRQEHRNG